MKIVTITMMRKNSKRLPNKCMLPVDGKPLYKYTIDFALMLGYDYYLFTDYDNLELPSKVNLIKRLPEFSGDKHKTNQEILWSKIDADIYIFLQVTNPVRNIDRVKAWINRFIADDFICGLSAKRCDKFIYSEDAVPLNFSQVERTDNGCNKDSVFIENGNFYIFRKQMLYSKHLLDSADKIIFDDDVLFDIDTIEDLRELEKYLQGRKENG